MNAANDPIEIAASDERTLASRVYRRLQNDILRSRVEPGHNLSIQVLRDRYGVGSSPLREALNRLAECGLVVREEHKGFRVAPASTQELLEIVRTRCWLEEIALRESIRQGDEHWEERVLLAYHRLSRTPPPEGEASLEYWPEWEKRHRDFHIALLSACNSKILVDYCSQLQARTFRYRNIASVRAYRRGLAVDEHCELHTAALERDAERAVDLLTTHYQATGEVIAKSGV